MVLVSAMSLPMLVLYAMSSLGPFITQDLHIHPGLLGYVIFSSFAVAALLSLVAGRYVDRLGSRNALLLLFLVVALAFSLIGFTSQFSGLMSAAALCGVAQALANPVTNLLIAQQVPPKQKAFTVGLKQSGVQVAALFAGLILPTLASILGWRNAVVIIVPLCLLLAVTSTTVTPNTHTPKDNALPLTAPNQRLSLLMGVQFCVGVSLSAFVIFVPLFAHHLGMAKPLAGLLIAGFGAMGILSRILLTSISAKMREEAVLLAILIAVAALAVLLTTHATPSRYWPIWCGVIGMGLTAVATNAIAMGMLIRDPTLGALTTASGFVSVAFFGGFAVGAPIFGAIINSSLGYGVGWKLLCSILLLGCFIASLLIVARHRATRAKSQTI